MQSPLVLALAAPIAGWLLDHDGAVGDAVDDAVDDAVGGASRGYGHLRTYVSDNWHRFIGGQFWVGGWYWGSPSFVSFFREVCGLALSTDMAQRAVAYEETARTACWWWPHREFVMVCERPKRIRRDEQGRLHCETGKAIEFRDGWGLSAWHGTVVPHEWIEQKATYDPRAALTHPNVEQRRAAAEIFGWARVLAEVPTRVLNTDADPEIGELLSVDLGAQGDVMFRRVAELPADARKVERTGPIVVAHSETGHHHVIEAPHVLHYETGDPLIGYVVDIPGTRAPVDVEHMRSFDTHETIRLLNDAPEKPAVWQIIREREWVPEGWQRAQD